MDLDERAWMLEQSDKNVEIEAFVQAMFLRSIRRTHDDLPDIYTDLKTFHARIL